MKRPAAVVEGLLSRPWRWPQELAALADSRGPGLVSALLAELDRTRDLRRRLRVVRALQLVPASAPGGAFLTSVQQLGRVAEHLRAEPVGGSPFRIPALHDANLELFQAYTSLFLRLGPVTLPVLRELLAVGPLPVNQFGYDSSTYHVYGAQLTALQVLEQHGEAGDARRLRPLVSHPGESVWVRAEAAVVWARWEPEAAAAAAAAHCLTTPVLPALLPTFAVRLGRLGGPLAVAVLDHLDRADPTDLNRCAAVLLGIGRAAVPALTHFLGVPHQAASWVVAAQVLAVLDGAALAGTRRGPLARGLSSCGPSASATRGLSRVG